MTWPNPAREPTGVGAGNFAERFTFLGPAVAGLDSSNGRVLL